MEPANPPVHGILQARMLEWVAIPFFRGSSQPTDRTWVSHIAGKFFTNWAMKEAHCCTLKFPKMMLITAYFKHLLPPLCLELEGMVSKRNWKSYGYKLDLGSFELWTQSGHILMTIFFRGWSETPRDACFIVIAQNLLKWYKTETANFLTNSINDS